MSSLFGRILSTTRLGWLPVRARSGLNRGAWWSLYPHSAYWRGDFEPELQSTIARLAPRPGECAWDLGAHFGFYTLALAQAVGPSGCVVALEPDADSFRRLTWHMKLNGQHHVRCHRCAASASKERQFLVQSEGGGATTSHLAYRGESIHDDTPGRWIDTVALDALRGEENLRAPTFIKIDVEGHGASALRGAEKTLAEARPCIVMSFHSPEETADTAAIIEPLGYQPYDLAGARITWAATTFQTVVLRSNTTPG